MNHTEMLTYIKDAVEADLSPKYIAAGVPDMEDWLKQTPYDGERRQFSVFMGGGSESYRHKEYGFVVQLVLPREENPDRYLTLLLESLRTAIIPSKMGVTSLEDIDYVVLYPGDLPEGGFGSFIQATLVYNQSLDDCD